MWKVYKQQFHFCLSVCSSLLGKGGKTFSEGRGEIAQLVQQPPRLRISFRIIITPPMNQVKYSIPDPRICVLLFLSSSVETTISTPLLAILYMDG